MMNYSDVIIQNKKNNNELKEKKLNGKRQQYDKR